MNTRKERICREPCCHLVPPLVLLLLLLGENMSLQLSKVGEANGVAGKKGVPAAEADPGVR
jgi:hypothetical protein